MALQQLKEKAHLLRSDGRSIGKIAKTLCISKSTVSYWCRDIVLSKLQLQVLAKRQRKGGALGRLRAAEQKRIHRIERVALDMKQGAQDVGTLSKRDIFILGLALYWGEGYKNGNEECGLTNSDPVILRAFIAWLKHIYSIERKDLIARVSLNEIHQTRIAAIEKHWSRILCIPRAQFTRTSLIKTKVQKIYSNPNQHFGTLRIKVRRGTSLRRRIMGSINALKESVSQRKISSYLVI